MRRAGKSPPGGASRARPHRASSGPRSSTEPRRLPTSAASGSPFVICGHLTRTVVVPSLRPRRRDRRAASPSPRHRRCVACSSARILRVVSRQAAKSGSAAFLFPSTARRPESGCPPSINSVDIDQLTVSAHSGLRNSPRYTISSLQLDAELLPHLLAAPLNQSSDVARRRGAIVHDEVAVCR